MKKTLSVMLLLGSLGLFTVAGCTGEGSFEGSPYTLVFKAYGKTKLPAFALQNPTDVQLCVELWHDKGVEFGAEYCTPITVTTDAAGNQTYEGTLETELAYGTGWEMAYLKYRTFHITPDQPTEYTEVFYPREPWSHEYYSDSKDVPQVTKRETETYEIDFTGGIPEALADRTQEILHYDLPRTFDVDSGILMLIPGERDDTLDGWHRYTADELGAQVQRFCALEGYPTLIEYREWRHCCEDAYKGTAFTFPASGVTSSQIENFYYPEKHLDSITCARPATAAGDRQLRDFAKTL